MNFKPTLALGILLSVTTLNANAAGLNPYTMPFFRIWDLTKAIPSRLAKNMQSWSHW